MPLSVLSVSSVIKMLLFVHKKRAPKSFGALVIKELLICLFPAAEQQCRSTENAKGDRAGLRSRNRHAEVGQPLG